MTYQNVNKLAIYKNCDLDNFPLALRNSEGVTNIKEEALCGKKLCLFPRLVNKFAIVYFFENLKTNDAPKNLFSLYIYIYIYIYTWYSPQKDYLK